MNTYLLVLHHRLTNLGQMSIDKQSESRVEMIALVQIDVDVMKSSSTTYSFFCL